MDQAAIDRALGRFVEDDFSKVATAPAAASNSNDISRFLGKEARALLASQPLAAHGYLVSFFAIPCRTVHPPSLPHPMHPRPSRPDGPRGRNRDQPRFKARFIHVLFGELK